MVWIVTRGTLSLNHLRNTNTIPLNRLNYEYIQATGNKASYTAFLNWILFKEWFFKSKSRTRTLLIFFLLGHVYLLFNLLKLSTVSQLFLSFPSWQAYSDEEMKYLAYLIPSEMCYTSIFIYYLKLLVVASLYVCSICVGVSCVYMRAKVNQSWHPHTLCLTHWYTSHYNSQYRQVESTILIYFSLQQY